MLPLVIDVRTKEEYARRHVAEAVNIPLEEIIVGKLWVLEGVSRDTPLYLYCRSGNRSEKAKGLLLTLGFTRVTNLGGLEDAEREVVLL